MSSTANTIPIEAWNTILFEKFSRFRTVLTEGLSDHSDELSGDGPTPPLSACSISAAASGTRPD